MTTEVLLKVRYFHWIWNYIDYQYDGFAKKMADLLKTKYLEKEMLEFWQKGEKYYKAPEDNLAQIHSFTIYVYTKCITASLMLFMLRRIQKIMHSHGILFTKAI